MCTSTPCGNIKVVREPYTVTLATTYIREVGSNLSTISGLQAFGGAQSSVGASGQMLTHQTTQTGVSVEMPLYNNNRFTTADPTITGFGQAYDETDRDGYQVEIERYPGFVNNHAPLLQRYCSIGSDFTFFFYLNAPIMYYMNAVPTAGSAP